MITKQMIRESILEEIQQTYLETVLTLFPESDLVGTLYSISGWFQGSGMNISNKKRWWIEKRASEFKQLFELFPDKIPTRLYRLTAIERVENAVGKQLEIKIGNKDILSFSSNPQTPRQFYKDIYQNISTRKDKRFQYVSISLVPDSEQILMSIGSTIKFVEFLFKNLNKIAEIDPYYNKRIGEYGQLSYMVRELLRRLKTKFISGQQEWILYIPDGTAEVKIEEVIYDSIEKATPRNQQNRVRKGALI